MRGRWAPQESARPSTSLQNARGAAFLLSVYLAALTLLLLGGVSFQRTATEVRASQLSRDLGQAFFLAEAGMDHALQTAARNGAFSGTLPGGSYTYSVRPTHYEVLNPQRMRVQYTITSTGTANGRREIVTGIVVREESLRDGFAQSRIRTGGCSSNIVGDVHNSDGVPGSVILNGDYNRIDGNLTLGPPKAPPNGYQDLWGLLDTSTSPDTIFWGTNPGIYLQSNTVPSWTRLQWLADNSPVFGGDKKAVADYARQGVITGNVSVAGVSPINPIPSPYPPWNGSWPVGPDDMAKRLVLPGGTPSTPGTRLDIYDGNATWDASGPSDDRIDLRVTSLQLWPYSKLILHAPTRIYVESSESIKPTVQAPNGVIYTYNTKIPVAAYVGPGAQLIVVDDKVNDGVDNGQTVKSGFEILVTQKPPDKTEAGTVVVTGPLSFFGSIWAPESLVVAGAMSTAPGYDPVTDTLSIETCEAYNVGTCPGGLAGLQSGYIIAKDLYVGERVVVGKVGNQVGKVWVGWGGAPPIDDYYAPHTLSAWISGTPEAP